MNDINKNKLIKAFIRSQKVGVVCLQETNTRNAYYGNAKLGSGKIFKVGCSEC